MAAVGTAVTSIIGYIGDVVTALFHHGDGTSADPDGALYALLPFFAIGIACSVVLFGVKGIRSLVWGA